MTAKPVSLMAMTVVAELQNNEGMQIWLSRLESFFQQTAKTMIVLVPHMEADVRKRVCQSMASACEAKAAADNVLALEYLADALDHALQADLEAHPLQYKLDKAMQRVLLYQEKVKQFCVGSGQDTAFAFVEADFVDAVRLGHWVLLDNVNSAPPEVVERINSVLEEDPSLNIHEHSGGMSRCLAV